MGKFDRQVYSLSGFIAGLNLNMQRCELSENYNKRRIKLIEDLNKSLDELRLINLETEKEPDIKV